MDFFKNTVTPACEFKYPRVNSPSTKFNPDGVYEVDIILDPDNNTDHKKFMSDVDELLETAKDHVIEKAKTPAKKNKLKKYSVVSPWKEELDDEGEETGRITLKIKQKAIIRPEGKDPINIRIPVVDAKRQPVGEMVGSGTVGKLSMQVAPYAMDSSKNIGITCRLKAVQVLQIVEYAGGGDGTDLFEEEEDGFTSEKSPPTSDSFTNNTDSDDGASEVDEVDEGDEDSTNF